MISTSDFEKGLWIDIDGEPWQIVDVNRQSPSARGASMIVKAKLKNPRTGLVQEKSFRGGDKVAAPQVDERVVQFVYADGDELCFMDAETFEQSFLRKADVGDAADYLIEQLELTLLRLGEEVLGVRLPNHVDLLVTETPPPVKLSGSGSTTKPATLETGLVIQVPPYLEAGERVRVDTRDGRFVSRAKDEG
ncbi:MAG: elongation factor P [Planctomycetota bacterium]